MNGNWTMMGWALPPPQFMPVLPFLPQMPQNLGLLVPDQDLPHSAPFPDPSQPQFYPPPPPSVSSAASFRPGPPSSFPAGVPSTASTSPGPPSVVSFPTAGTAPTRAWLQPEPLPSHVCRLCAGLVSDPPAFTIGLDQRNHAKAHSAQVKKRLAEVFPFCFPDAPAPVERDAVADKLHSKCGDNRIPQSKSTEKRALKSKSSEKPDMKPVSSEATALKPATSEEADTKTDHASGAHICPYCGASYSTSAFLDKHVHLCRRRPKEFPCPECSSSFAAKHNLTRHVETVHSPPKHQCHICGKWFTRKSDCAKHMHRQHSNSNLLKCSLCNYSTSYQYNLTTHMSTHSSQKSFACPLCSASFGANKQLKPHLDKAHSPGRSPLLCPHCGWAFAGKINLSVHINRLHKES